MSNEEKNKRAKHLAFRKKWSNALIFAIAAITLLTAFSLYSYHKNSDAIYIEYTESSNVDYKVYYEDNEFFKDEYVGKDQAYIASLIEKIVADFNYEINMQSSTVLYKYSYSIDTQLEIYDNEFKKPIYNPVEVLVEEKTYQQSSSDKLVIKEQIEIDYNAYNEVAEKFIEEYDLSRVDCNIIVKMHINVVSTCEDFAANANDNYTVTLSIPLTNKTTDVTFTSSIPASVNKILACGNAATNSQKFKTLTVIGIALDIVLVVFLLAFLWLTRDQNTDYASKVSRIVKNYRSYIQQIFSLFDDSEYQTLKLATINELLEIRDTLQRPILFHENEDKTCAKFFIITDNKIIYLFQIDLLGYEEGIYVNKNYENDDLMVDDHVYTASEEYKENIDNGTNYIITEPKEKIVKVIVKKRNRKKIK